MNAINAYFDVLAQTLARARDTQTDALEAGARMLCEATLAQNNIFAFGCSHAGLVTLELYYRTGGMATINPVRAPGLHLDVNPATMTSQMERLPGYGAVIVDALPLRAGDVLIVHSVSGRNAVPIDVALRAKEKGARMLVMTNMATTLSVASRHPSGKKLYELADVLLDDCGAAGDSSISVEGIPEKVAPTSTVLGAALLNAMVARALQMIAASGAVAPVFVSANVDGGDEHNRMVLDAYSEHIFYM